MDGFSRDFSVGLDNAPSENAGGGLEKDNVLNRIANEDAALWNRRERAVSRQPQSKE
jgi:hypothetical protein